MISNPLIEIKIKPMFEQIKVWHHEPKGFVRLVPWLAFIELEQGVTQEAARNTDLFTTYKLRYELFSP